MDTWKTQRGFYRCEFTDERGNDCVLAQSSQARYLDDAPGHSFLWLGRSGNEMHLSRENVLELVVAMTCWLERNRFDLGSE